VASYLPWRRRVHKRRPEASLADTCQDAEFAELTRSAHRTAHNRGRQRVELVTITEVSRRATFTEAKSQL